MRAYTDYHLCIQILLSIEDIRDQRVAYCPCILIIMITILHGVYGSIRNKRFAKYLLFLHCLTASTTSQRCGRTHNANFNKMPFQHHFKIIGNEIAAVILTSRCSIPCVCQRLPATTIIHIRELLFMAFSRVPLLFAPSALLQSCS